MGEIPEDVMAVAVDVHDGTRDYTRFAKIHHIAEALLAERKRCADVAKQVADEGYGDMGAIATAASINRAILNP